MGTGKSSLAYPPMLNPFVRALSLPTQLMQMTSICGASFAASPHHRALRDKCNMGIDHL